MSISAEDLAIMGTPEAAKEALLVKVREYRECRRPRVAPAAEHRKIEKREHQVRFELAEAAMLLLWHEENRSQHETDRTFEIAGDGAPMTLAKTAYEIALDIAEALSNVSDPELRYIACRKIVEHAINRERRKPANTAS